MRSRGHLRIRDHRLFSFHHIVGRAGTRCMAAKLFT